MPHPPPRKRFQIHLSTAIVMMFVAGGVMWMNFGSVQEYTVNWVAAIHYVPEHESHRVIGWPFVTNRTSATIGDLYVDENVPFPPKYSKLPIDVYEFKWTPMVLDIGIALATLFATWFLCEWLIRRAARKGG